MGFLAFSLGVLLGGAVGVLVGIMIAESERGPSK